MLQIGVYYIIRIRQDVTSKNDCNAICIICNVIKKHTGRIELATHC